MAAALVDIAFDGAERWPTVCDPACGDGVFLLAAATALERRGAPRDHIARHLLWGCDIDAGAVQATRRAVQVWSGVDPGDHVVTGDGLTLAARWCGRFDAVVGNPPFLYQLERASMRRDALPADLEVHARPYTDTAWLFLLVARTLLRDGGRAVLVQPHSILAARDAAPIREELSDDLAGLWWCDDELFDATVRVCAPVLGRATHDVTRWTGRDATPIAGADRPSSSWAPLVPTSAPIVDLCGTSTLAALATATAGFRDEYYGLIPAVVDRCEGDDPLLVTSGLVDVNAMRWGTRPTRFARRRFEHPRVELGRLDGPVARWVHQRLEPKVVVATQTKVVEAAVDLHGRWVPSTPVIAVHAPDADLWRVAAVLSAPAVSAWALAHTAGTALAPDAIKLSARQVLTIPLPPDEAAWARGADALADGDPLAAGAEMGDAYGVDDGVLRWWAGRLPQ